MDKRIIIEIAYVLLSVSVSDVDIMTKAFLEENLNVCVLSEI